VLENHATGGSAIVMNPQTGEILAMANEPTFNPNAYRDAEDPERRNRAVQDLYEPGSTFKIVTASAALEEKVFPVDRAIDVSGGRIRSASVSSTTRTTTACSRSPTSSSSRATSARSRSGSPSDQPAQRIRPPIRLGRPVSPDFPGENGGIVWDREKWTESALASVSMG
jgi:cell division protein FtsI (penicillin-binding protein 3)